MKSTYKSIVDIVKYILMKNDLKQIMQCNLNVQWNGQDIVEDSSTIRSVNTKEHENKYNKKTTN